MAEKAKLDKETQKSHKAAETFTQNERNQIRELFESIYVANKWQIVRVNFLRGMAFGLGTLVGGTIVVAIAVWILSQTIDLFPWAQDFTQRLIDSLNNR